MRHLRGFVVLCLFGVLAGGQPFAGCNGRLIPEEKGADGAKREDGGGGEAKREEKRENPIEKRPVKGGFRVVELASGSAVAGARLLSVVWAGAKIPGVQPVAGAQLSFLDGTTIKADQEGVFTLEQIPAAVREAATVARENGVEVLVTRDDAPQSKAALAAEREDIPLEVKASDKDVVVGLVLSPPSLVMHQGDLSLFRVSAITAQGRHVSCLSAGRPCKISWSLLQPKSLQADSSGKVLQVEQTLSETLQVALRAKGEGIRLLQATCSDQCPKGLLKHRAQTRVVVTNKSIQFVGALQDEKGNDLKGDWIVLLRAFPPEKNPMTRRIPYPGKGCLPPDQPGLPAGVDLGGACLYSNVVLLAEGNQKNKNLDVRVLLGQRKASGKIIWYRVKDGDPDDDVQIDDKRSAFVLPLPAPDSLPELAGLQLKMTLQKSSKTTTLPSNPPPLNRLVQEVWASVQNMIEDSFFRPGSGIRRALSLPRRRGSITTGPLAGWSYEKPSRTSQQIKLTLAGAPGSWRPLVRATPIR